MSAQQGKGVEERLQLLEDREAIRQLQATYCFLVDDGRFEDLAQQWFTEDARCEFGDTGSLISPFVSNGRAEILSFYKDVVAVLLAGMCHTIHNARIAVEGNVARGECYFEVTASHPATGEAVVGAGRYLDRYRRTAEGWRVSERVARIFHMTSLEDGWVKRPLLRALTGE